MAPFFVPASPVARAHTREGVLSGRAFAAKDLFAIAGHTASAGHPDWKRTHPPAERNASVIDRLLAQGADLAGVTIMDELAYSLAGQNIHYGTPENPCAKGRLCGGSSCGSAAAVAAHACDFAIGTDTGGSIRVPAAFTGLFGMRPSHGAVPVDGAIALAPSFDTVGAFTRDGALLSEVMRVLLGSPKSTRFPHRLLFCDVLFSGVEYGVQNAFEKAILRLSSLLSLPIVPCENFMQEGLSRWALAFRRIQAREVWSEHAAFVSEVKPAFGPGVRERFEAAQKIAETGEGADEDEALRAAITKRIDALLIDETSVLLLPSAPGIAPLREASGAALEAFRTRTLELTCIASLSGIAQLSVPVAFAAAPLGLSLAARSGADDVLVNLAEALPLSL